MILKFPKNYWAKKIALKYLALDLYFEPLSFEYKRTPELNPSAHNDKNKEVNSLLCSRSSHISSFCPP